MTRLLLSLAVLAFFALCVHGMWRGWQRRARRQAEVLAEFPQPPSDTGDVVLETSGVYVGTTIGGDWQDRVAVGDIGHRAEMTLRLSALGLLVERSGAQAMWIPKGSLREARTARALAGKVMSADGLLVVRWQLGDQMLDTGFRGDDKDAYEQWVGTLNALVPTQGGTA